MKNSIKSALTIVISIAMLLGLATGCGTASASAKDLSDEVNAQKIDTSGALTDDAINSINAFSAELFKQAIAEGKENTFISPVSLMLALGMTANGASGETLTAFEQVLGKSELTVEELNLAYKALNETLSNVGGDTTLNIANSVWYNKNKISVYKDFLQTSADYYGSDAYSSDFSTKAVKEINSWVSNKTNGLITDLVENIDNDALMLLIDTVYFKANWQSEFDANNNFDGDFNLADGSTVNATYMSSGIKEQTYLSADGAQGILLPYSDGELSYIAILPPEGMSAAEYASSFDENTISTMLKSAKKEKVVLHIPKYTSYFSMESNDILKSMGLSAAFDGSKADFTKMGKAETNIYINDVLQKTYIAVNEKGTEAAAATKIEMMGTGMPNMTDTIELSFDRPFVYAIIEQDTGIPIFIGSLDNPNNN